MPTQPQKRKINPLAIIAIILILLALGMLFLIFAPGPRMKWALSMGEKYLTECDYTQAVTMFSRAIRVDAAETGDPMMALAQQFADQDYDVLLYDEHSNQNRRGDFVVQMVKDSGAQGLVLFMQQFCDPEEMEYPYLKKALDDAGIPHVKLGVDQQMRDFGQASTAIQAFADVL